MSEASSRIVVKAGLKFATRCTILGVVDVCSVTWKYVRPSLAVEKLLIFSPLLFAALHVSTYNRRPLLSKTIAYNFLISGVSPRLRVLIT